jgi:hypothetical protein
MTRTGILAIALLLPSAAAMAQRPPIQEMRLSPLTTPGQPQPQPPVGASPGQIPGQTQPRPASPATPQAPGQVTVQTPGQPPMQFPVPAPGQPPDPSRALLQTPDQDQILGGTETETPAAPPNGQSDQPPPPVGPPQPQWSNQWVPGGSARLQALDKVSAQATMLTVKVGEPATFGSLTISVKACVIRPPDQPADAAAYLDVTDSHPDSPGFNGWMLANEPSVSMMQNPIYDLRVAGCG